MDKEKIKESLGKMYSFFVTCFAVLATIGGTAYLFYDGHIFFGICNLLLAGMALPYVVKRFKILIA